MLKVGITGGIGCGKTTVSKVFETLGIPVYYADAEAKRLIENDPALIHDMTQAFGSACYVDGVYQRAYMAELIFKHPEQRKKINDIIHPHTILDAERWMNKQQAPFTLKEAALIFESGAEKQLDFIIGVSTPMELRIQRVMQRDGLSKADIITRINAQMDESLKLSKCNAILINDESTLLLPQIEKLYHELLENASTIN
jgi:dephospho-CoA kinase